MSCVNLKYRTLSLQDASCHCARTQPRSVDELTTFYILRWVNNVFHILLKIWHIIVWFGPNCSGKSTPSFRIYDMIKKYAEISFSPCVYNRKNVHYVANGII